MTSTAVPVATRPPPLAAIAGVSLAAVASQIVLLRLFSIIQWHHFAWLVISLALLGYGAAGTLVTLLQDRLLRRPGASIAGAMAAFALAVLPAFALAQLVSFNPEEMLWRPLLALRLGLIYLVLAVPFLFAACAIAVTLRGWPGRAGRIYAADLTGAGLGSVASLALLAVLPPLAALVVTSLVGLAAAALAAVTQGLRGRAVQAIGLAVLVLAGIVFPLAIEVRPSPYKDLSQALVARGAFVEAERHGVLGTVSVVHSPQVPTREAPGLSLLAPAGPPEQRAVFVNGDAAGAVTAGGADAAAFTGWMPTALPYALRAAPRVLVPQSGPGLAVLQSLGAGAEAVQAVDPRRTLLALVLEEYGAFSGGLYQRPEVALEIEDPRAFVARGETEYDLVQLPAAGALGGTGLEALGEDSLRTREHVARMLARLSPDGMLAASCWIDLPLRTCLRLAATLLDALEASGSEDPAAHVVAVRSWQLATFVVSPRRWSSGEIGRLREFAAARAFDVAWYPGMPRAEANRVNRMAEPYLYDGIAALSGPRREAFVEDYLFDIRPVTDDRPFGTSFLKLSSLPELRRLAASGALGLLDAGPVVLGVALLHSLVISLVLLVAPLAGASSVAARGLGLRGVAYFTAIGLGFMLLEMALLQRLSLLLADPVRSAAVVIAGMLVMAGAGSAVSKSLAARLGAPRLVRLTVLAIALVGLALLGVMPAVTEYAGGWPLTARMTLAVGLVAPLAFLMGQMLPVALERLPGAAVPWAWAVNGCASVTGAVLATLIAVGVGFGACVLGAVALYGVAAATLPVADAARPA